MVNYCLKRLFRPCSVTSLATCNCGTIQLPPDAVPFTNIQSGILVSKESGYSAELRLPGTTPQGMVWVRVRVGQWVY